MVEHSVDSDITLLYDLVLVMYTAEHQVFYKANGATDDLGARGMI